MASYVPGDVEISSLVLEGRDFAENFTKIVTKEHIFAPFVKTLVDVSQYTGEMGNFDGTRESSVVFKTPDGLKRRYEKLLTNGLYDVAIDAAERARNFTTQFVSKHALINSATPNFQKAFKNKQISGVIEGILKDGLGVDLPINIDKTKGLHGSDDQPIILTQKSPLRHIDDLRRMAISDQNYDGFLLFSGIGSSGGEELNFKSIYDMLKKDVVAEITNLSNYEVNSDLGAPIMHNVIEMFMAAGPNQQGSFKKGAFSKNATRYDVNKAAFDVPKLVAGKARQMLGSATSLNPGQVSGFVNNPFNSMPGTYNVLLEDSRRPDSHRAETAPYTEALFADMMTSFFTIKIPGDTNLKIGDIIHYSGRENTDNFLNKDTQVYGKHIITGITNYIGPISDRPRFVTYLDLVNIQSYNGVIS